MNKSQLLRACNYILPGISAIILASGIQLEVTSGAFPTWIWVHIFIGILFFGFIGWHLYLHFRWRNWLGALWKQKSPVTRWLTLFGIFTLITAVIATVAWIGSPVHSKIGAIHGKLGFIFVILSICHLLRRINYYRKTHRNKR